MIKKTVIICSIFLSCALNGMYNSTKQIHPIVTNLIKKNPNIKIPYFEGTEPITEIPCFEDNEDVEFLDLGKNKLRKITNYQEKETQKKIEDDWHELKQNGQEFCMKGRKPALDPIFELEKVSIPSAPTK